MSLFLISQSSNWMCASQTYGKLNTIALPHIHPCSLFFITPSYLRKYAKGGLADFERVFRVVTDLVTKQNANSKVGVYLRGKPRIYWLREEDLNLRPLGYEPNELPDCSIAR